jgi:cytochrome P450
VATGERTDVVDPLSYEFRLDPAAASQGLLEQGAVVWSEPIEAFMVVRHAEVRAAFGDAETFSSQTRRGLPVPAGLRDRIPEEWERIAQVIHGNQLSNSDPPVHTAQRRTVQRAFTPKRVASTQPLIEAIAHELIDDLEDRGGCDLVQDFGVQVTVRVVGAMLGLPREMIPGFLAWIGDVLRVLTPKDTRPEDVTIPADELVGTFARLHAAYETYADFLDQRRVSPGDDLASAMLALTDEDDRPALSTDQVLAHMLGVTAAGTDTTAALITNMVRYFTELPDQLELVRREPALWENAVQEGLRRSAVALHSLRICTRDTEIAGVAIPRDSKVWLGIASANADPRVFADPLRFDVRRANAHEHVAFGRGHHFCLGAPLARPEARVALQVLYERLPDLQADLGHPLTFVPSLLARLPASQPVTW